MAIPRRSNKENVEWSERVVSIQRVTKVVKGGKKMSFRAVVVIGNEKGKVGVGVGKAGEVIVAVRKAVTDGKKNIINVPLTSSNSIPHITKGRFGAAKLVLCPATHLVQVLTSQLVVGVSWCSFDLLARPLHRRFGDSGCSDEDLPACGITLATFRELLLAMGKR